MIDPNNEIAYRVDSWILAEREQKRLATLAEFGLVSAESIPIFEEATQIAAQFFNMPLCILGIVDRDCQWLKATVIWPGLTQLNQLVSARKIPRTESFCNQVIESRQVLVIRDTASNPLFAHRSLVQQDGIRAYLGVPLLTVSGDCLGTLAVMDLAPRTFHHNEIQFLELTARWCMSELERQHLVGTLAETPEGKDDRDQELAGASLDLTLNPKSPAIASIRQNHASVPGAIAHEQQTTGQIKEELLTLLIEELRTPLTSVMGMTSVLNREIYGPLTGKQKEYLEIIHDSGRYLLSLVDQVVALDSLDDSEEVLQLSAADIEMLCQQVIKPLEQVAKRREIQIQLSVEPGHRIWFLDKGKVYQILYHLIFNVIQSAEVSSVVRLHVSRKTQRLNMAVWVSHPWLGEGLPLPGVDLYPNRATSLRSPDNAEVADFSRDIANTVFSQELNLNSTPSTALETGNPALDTISVAHSDNPREKLGLLLSCQLAQLHGGTISIQGSPAAGYRYMVSLPQLAESDEN